jgi:hypothetical protein
MSDDPPPATCSFCGKPFGAGPAPGVAGPAVFICRDCIGLCIHIMAMEAPDWLRATIAEAVPESPGSP